MNNKYLLDTNILLRLVLNDNNSQYHEIYNLFGRAENGKVELYCDVPSLFEFIFVLNGSIYSLDKKEIVNKLQDILSLKIVHFYDRDLFLSALDIFLNCKSNLSIIDCYLIARCKNNNLKFYTFDKKAKNI